MITKQRFTITYEREVDTDTGEILKTVIVDTAKGRPTKQSSTTTIDDKDPNPKVILLDNKLQLNKAALKALNVDAGDRIDIRYRDDNPLIGNSEFFNSSGCKVTKSGTISFRGKKSEELAKYGDCFEMQPYDGGVFLLKGNKEIEKPKGDENIQLPEENNTDLDLDEFLDDTKASMFQL